MYFRFDITGCLTLLLILALIVFIITKLWWLIAIMILIWLVNTYIAMFQEKMAAQKAEQEKFNPEPGQAYKVCPYCGEKVQVTDLKCPKCGRELG